MGVLADKIRAKYPGAYQGVADDQLEAAVVAKYPQYARVSAPEPAEPSLLQSAMAGPGQAMDRLLGAVVPGEAGKRLASNEATAGQELRKATVRGFDEPLGLSDFTPIGISSMAGGSKGIEHGRAIQGAVSEFAGDALRDPYTWGALGALKRLKLVGKGLTAGANAIFALKAGEAVPGEFAEAKRLYDEKGFTPEVTEAIAKGVLLGGAAAMGARGTLKEGAQFGREATAAGGRAVRGAAEAVAKVPHDAAVGLGASAGSTIGGILTSGLGGFGTVPGALAGGKLGAMVKALAERMAAQKAGVPTEVVDVPADFAPGETLRPVPTAAQRPARVPEFSPEAMGLELLPEATSAAPPAAPRPAPVEAPAPAAPRTMAEVLASRTPEGGWADRPSIQDVLDATRLAKPVEFPGMTAEDAAIQAAAQEASVARVKAKDLMARAFEAQLKAQAPGAKPATVKAAERAQQKALEAKTLADTLMARFDEAGDWNPEYPQWSPAMPAEARWANQPPNPEVAGITPPRGGHVPVGAEVFPRRPGEAAPAAAAAPPEAPPPAPPVEAPALLPEGQRAMPGGRSGEAQAPPAEFRGLDTPEKQAAFAQLQRLLAGEPVEAAPAPKPVVVRTHGAGTDAVAGLTRQGHAYRGMTKAEYDATVGAGAGVKSSGKYSHPSEGTSFAEDAGTAESYANFGRDDPRKTGVPTYLVETSRQGMKLDRDGYLKAPETVTDIKRVWEMSPDGDVVVAREITSPGKHQPVEAAPAKAPTKTARQTWPQFNKERMGKYMKEFGSHAAAIRKIAEEWAAYKAQV